MQQRSGGYLQYFKLIHAKLKKKERIAHVQLSQAMIYYAARVRSFSTKFSSRYKQPKRDTSAHAQLLTLQLRSKAWFIMWHESGGYLQSFKSIHAKVKKIDLRMPSCAPCRWDPSHEFIMQQGTGGYLQNFKSIHTKLKEIDLRMHSCAPCDWDSSHDLWCSKGQEVMYKISSQYVIK